MAQPFPVRFRLFLLAALLAVGGCGHQTPNGTDSSATDPETAEPTTRPFPAESLYQLLVAETAANRGQLDVALANYYQQAHKTRDPGVVQRATLLAQHLNAAQAALDLAQLWASIEPANPEPVYLAGQYLITFQRLDLAMQQSRRLLEMGARPLFLAIASSPAAAAEPMLGTLTREYQTLLQQHPDNIDLLLGHALLLETADNLPDALDTVRHALRADSKDLQARLFEVDLLYKSGRPDQAIRRMGQIVADEPDNTRLRLEYARILTDHDLKKAREQFDYLARQNSLEPDLLLARALVNYRLKDMAQAREYFEQLLFLKKYTDTAQYYLGEIRLERQEPEKALEHYRRVSGGSEYLPANVRAFDLAIQLDRRLEGQQWLAKQRASHPELATRLYLIEADVLMQRGDIPRSLAALDEAISRNPEQLELYYARSLLHERSGDDRAAERDLRIVLQKQPGNVDALNALGYVLANSNRQLEEALNLITQALAQRPEDPAIMDSMGWVLFRLGRHEEALFRLRKAFSLYPNDEVAAHLGEVLWTVGQRHEAEKIWQQGFRLKPDSELIRSTRERLSNAPVSP